MHEYSGQREISDAMHRDRGPCPTCQVLGNATPKRLSQVAVAQTPMDITKGSFEISWQSDRIPHSMDNLRSTVAHTSDGQF